jgi:hypothetical protein
MDSSRRIELHEVLKGSLRQKILLKLGQHNSLSIDSLAELLRTGQSEVEGELSALQSLTVHGEHLVTKDGNAYALTEKGHDVLDCMIAYPELTLESQSKPKPKWFTPYWVALIVLTVIVTGVVIPVFGYQSLDKAAVYTVAALLAIGLAFYIRVKPSVAVNKVMYVGVLGFVIGCLFWFVGLIIAIFLLSHAGAPHTEATDNALFVVLTSLSFTLGPLTGYLIGKARHFKGPEQYSP